MAQMTKTEILKMIDNIRAKVLVGDIYDLLEASGRLEDLAAEINYRANKQAQKAIDNDDQYVMRTYCMKAYLAEEPDAEIPVTDEEWRKLFASLFHFDD